MREPQKKVIEGAEYTVRPLTGMRSLTFIPRLNKVLGPAVAALAAAKSLKDIGGDVLRDALAALGEALDEKEMEGIVRTLLSDCEFYVLDKSSPGGALMPRFDDWFQGRPEVALQLVWFALEVNYSGFFPALRRVGARAAAGGAPSTSPAS